MESYFESLNYHQFQKVIKQIFNESISLAKSRNFSPPQVLMASFTGPITYALGIDAGVTPLQSYNIALQIPNVIPIAASVGRQVAADLSKHKGTAMEKMMHAIDNAAKVMGEAVENIAQNEGVSPAAQQYIADKLEDITKRKTYGEFDNIIAGGGKTSNIPSVNASWIFGGSVLSEIGSWGAEKFQSAKNFLSNTGKAALGLAAAAPSLVLSGIQQGWNSIVQPAWESYGQPAINFVATNPYGKAAAITLGILGAATVAYKGTQALQRWSRNRETARKKQEADKKAKMEEELYAASNSASQALQELNEKIRRSQYSSGDNTGGINQALLAQMSQLQQPPLPPVDDDSDTDSDSDTDTDSDSDEEESRKRRRRKRRKSKHRKPKKKRAKKSHR